MSNQNDRPNAIAEFMPHIGMRKIKTLLSILVGFLTWQLIRVCIPGLAVHPYLTYIYGMVEIRDSSAKTKEMGGRRFKITLIGLVVGVVFLLLKDFLDKQVSLSWIRALIEISLVMLGVLITISIAEKADCKTSCGLAAIVFIVVVLNHTTEDVFSYALMRFVQTMLGLFSAWLINVKLFPYPRKKV